jgi:c-di-GMP-related signal transduction protein
MSAAASDLFLVGLLSAMDAILDMEIIDVLKEINVGGEIRDALLGKPNCLGEVFELAVNYEKGCWDLVTHSAAAMAIDETCLSPLYFDAVNWAEGTLLGR